jgi:DNA-binding FrmR family transcriptional regulator
MRQRAAHRANPGARSNTVPGYGKNREITLVRAEGGVYGYTEDKDVYLRRLRRIEGQIRGLQRMVEEDTYCIDIITQVSAATKALQAVALGLLEDHLGHCVAEAVVEGGDTASAKVKEASDAIARLVRS